MDKLLYMLPHGIKVVGEYPASGVNKYNRVRIKTHELFDAKIHCGCQTIRKSRVVMTSILGRILLKSEIIHHKNENKTDDRYENLEIITACYHNRHHKTGAKHTNEAKQKISLGLKLAIREGRRDPPPGNSFYGKRHSEESKRLMSETKKMLIKNGVIKKQTPPVMRGEDNNKTKISEKNVIEIRIRAAAGESKTLLANEFNIVIQSVYNIVNRTTWSHVL